MSHTSDSGRLVDPARTIRLDEVGGEDLSAGVTVGPDGTETLWLIARPQLGVEGTDHGNERPPHELVGPLPEALRDRIWQGPICGRPTRGTGRPCRSRVARVGDACAWHTADAAEPQPGLFDRAGGGGA